MMNVLVLDDDPVARAMLRIMLEREGCTVVETATVAAARAVLGHEPISLVVVDYHLEGECGLDLAPELDELGVPVVLLSGSMLQSDQDDPRRALVVAHLSKPVSTEEIGNLLFGFTAV